MLPKSLLIPFLIVACASLLAQEPEYDCPYCKDTGKVDCPACKAQHDFWCSECAEQSPCSLCDGLGWLLCPECGGRDARAERDFLLERRKERRRISEAVGTRLRCIETPRFRLLTDIEHRKSHRYALILELYCGKFNGAFGADLEEKPWAGKCDVYLFQPREAFVKFAVTVDGRPEVAASGGYSCPSPGGPLIALFKEFRTDDDTIRTIIHELAHVCLGAYHKDGPIPDWVHEGVAQRFEFSYRTDTSRRRESLRRVKRALAHGKLMPLAELSEMRLRPSELLPYAAAWSAIDFLMASDREAFVNWIKLMKEGEEQHTAFETAFGAPLAVANRAWKAHTRRQQ